MKKLLVLLMTLLCCATAFAADADTKTDKQQGVNWEISMMPKPSAEEQEAACWSIVVENNVGVYAYDMDSLTFSKVTNGVVDKNIISVLTKTVFTEKNMLKKLDAQFKDKLAKKEKVQYCEILMTFNLQDKTYGVEAMDVYGSKKTLLSHQVKDLKFVPIPEGSFAEAMLEICQQAVAADAQAAGK